MRSVNIGIIGAGRIGKLHTAHVLKHLPQFKIKTIADPALDQAWFKTTGLNNSVSDPNDIFKDDDIEAVFICSPAPFHVAQIIAAAEAGKHIFCEKPISLEIEPTKLAIRAVKRANVKLQVGFNRRFDPNFSKVKKLIDDKSIGNPQMLRITSRDPKIPPIDFLKLSGGMFGDMTIHDFDMARFLMQSEIDEVYASANVLINPVFNEYDDIDTAIINLKFKNGTLGVIDNSRQAVYGYDQRIEVFGSHGSVQAENNKPTNTIVSTEQGVMTDKPLYYFLERYESSFVAELENFYDCIVSDKEPCVTGLDGLYSTLIGIAAEQSRRENKPIKINYDECIV